MKEETNEQSKWKIKRRKHATNENEENKEIRNERLQK
jgi:hypothetical protein